MSNVLKLLWPFLLRALMKEGTQRTAAYLEARRLQRLARAQELDAADVAEALVNSDEQIDLPLEIIYTPPPTSFFQSDRFWFTLSGIVLGVTLSIVATILKRETGKS
jgi:hypothetical protein